MKKIYSFLMALCVALCASATPYHFAKQHSVDFGNLVSTQTVSEAAAGTPLQYDATAKDGAAERTFTSQDDVDLVSGTGFFQIIATAADGSDCLGLVLFANADPTTKVPVGTYPINGTQQAGSALASTGLTKQGQLTLSFYAPKYNGGYIDLPIYWLVGGEVVVTCADNKLKFEVKAVNSNDVPVHVVCEYDLNAKQGMQYDEKKGDVNRTYTTEDILDIDTDYIAQYNLYVDIVAADYSDQVSLLFFVPAADPEIGIPAGTYPIVAEPAMNTVLASEGVTAQGGISPSFYGTLVEDGGQLYVDKLWFLVSGQVVVENINGKLKMTIDAVNSYDVPVKIVYNAAGANTAVDNVAVENNVSKVLENGQIFIMKDGVKYNAIGSVVK